MILLLGSKQSNAVLAGSHFFADVSLGRKEEIAKYDGQFRQEAKIGGLVYTQRKTTSRI